MTALEFYVQIFEEEGALDNFEAFASKNGPNFYELPLNLEKITLKKEKNIVPKHISTSKNEKVATFFGGAFFLSNILFIKYSDLNFHCNRSSTTLFTRAIRSRENASKMSPNQGFHVMLISPVGRAILKI